MSMLLPICVGPTLWAGYGWVAPQGGAWWATMVWPLVAILGFVEAHSLCGVPWCAEAGTWRLLRGT